jgi:hypothetical protein
MGSENAYTQSQISCLTMLDHAPYYSIQISKPLATLLRKQDNLEWLEKNYVGYVAEIKMNCFILYMSIIQILHTLNISRP